MAENKAQLTGFTVARIFGDNMVLQRQKPIRFWGESEKAQILEIYVNERLMITSQVDAGKWEIFLPAMTASRGLKMTIISKSDGCSYAFKNVAVGEVWIAGGQSNMAFPLEYDAEAEMIIPNVNNPDIRFYNVPRIKFQGQDLEDDFSESGFWRFCTPADAPFFSAVGFYFAQALAQDIDIPVGIIGCNWDGTSAAAWTDAQYLREDDVLVTYCQEYQDAVDQLNLENYLEEEKKRRELMKQPFPQKFLEFIMKNTPGEILYMLMTLVMKKQFEALDRMGPRSENRPGALYDHMVKKMAGYSARGVIWYQGEADSEKAHLYARLFSTLIFCWREAWGEALPFLFVQLAPFEQWLGLEAVNYPQMREQQEIVAESVAGAHMVSIMDSGARLDIHPKHKRPVGERLALLARGKVYGEDILCEAPKLSAARILGNDLILKFDHDGEGLSIRGEALSALEVVADSKTFSPCSVCIEKDEVKLMFDDLPSAEIVEVLFAYQNYAEVNLFNSAGLPARPFRVILSPFQADVDDRKGLD